MPTGFLRVLLFPSWGPFASGRGHSLESISSSACIGVSASGLKVGFLMCLSFDLHPIICTEEALMLQLFEVRIALPPLSPLSSEKRGFKGWEKQMDARRPPAAPRAGWLIRPELSAQPKLRGSESSIPKHPQAITSTQFQSS